MSVPADIERLVREHHAGVWRFLRLLGCDHAEADDLTQETFLVALKKPPQDRGAGATFAWLRENARFAFLEHRRKQARKAEVSLDALTVAEEEFARLAGDDGGSGWVEQLKTCIEALDERPRQAIERVYRDRLTIEQAAAQLGLKPNGLKTLLQRTREILRACVERKQGE